MPESLFNKGSGLQPAALLKDAAIRCFLVKFSKFKEEIIFKAQTKNCFCSLIVKRDSHFTVHFLGSSCGRFVNDRNFYKHFFLFLNFLCLLTTQKMKFSAMDFFSKYDQIRSFVTFTEEILNRKLHLLCSVSALN